MPANFNPIFPLTPVVTVGQLLSTAAGSTSFYSGTDPVGTALVVPYTAGVNGGRVDFIRVKYSGLAGTAPTGTTGSTKMHVFINNGAVNTTGSNNTFITDFLVPSVVMSNTTLNGEITVAVGISLPAGYRILVSTQAANGASNGAWAVTAIDGDY